MKTIAILLCGLCVACVGCSSRSAIGREVTQDTAAVKGEVLTAEQVQANIDALAKMIGPVLSPFTKQRVASATTGRVSGKGNTGSTSGAGNTAAQTGTGNKLQQADYWDGRIKTALLVVAAFLAGLGLPQWWPLHRWLRRV